MKKILVIMGSPRKGETFKVLQQIETLARSMGEVSFETLWLKDVNYGACRGCHACIKLGEQKCPLKDDMLAVEAKMMAADGLILATPVYSQQVSYLMKIFLDRYSYMWHRPRMFGKFVMGVAAGGGQFKSTLGYLKECVEAWGCTWAGELGAPHPDALQPKMRAKLEKDIVKSTRRFIQAVEAGKVPSPKLGRMIWFRMWRINARACQKDNPTDFKYWTEKGWFSQGFYTQQPLPLVYRLIARVVEPVLLRMMRSIYVGY